MRNDDSIENKGTAGEADESTRSNADPSTDPADKPESGPSGGRMTEGGEKPGSATNEESSDRTEPPVSGIERAERSEGIQSRGETVE